MEIHKYISVIPVIHLCIIDNLSHNFKDILLPVSYLVCQMLVQALFWCV